MNLDIFLESQQNYTIRFLDTCLSPDARAAQTRSQSVFYVNRNDVDVARLRSLTRSDETAEQHLEAQKSIIRSHLLEGDFCTGERLLVAFAKS